MFLVVPEEDFTDGAFICSKCTKINHLQDLLIELKGQIKLLTERNAILKEQSKLQDNFNSTVLVGSPGLRPLHPGLLAATLPLQDPPPTNTTHGAPPDPPATTAAPPHLSCSPTRPSPTNSTPQLPWKQVPRRQGRRSEGQSSSHHHPPPQLSNRFFSLAPHDHCSHPACPSALTHAPLPHPPQALRPPGPLNPRPPPFLLSQPFPSRPSGPSAPPSPLDSATAPMVIGSSLVHDIRLHPSSGPSKTLCFPGARILDIKHRLPTILTKYSNISTIIIHIGTNDIRARQSEVLKQDFQSLRASLLDTGNKIIISGPIPTTQHNRGLERWSRLFSLHTLMKDYCATTGISFINNFDLFWVRPIFLKPDGLHPNWRGSQMLSLTVTYFYLCT